MRKEKRNKWKRHVAAILAATLFVGNVDLSQFGKMKAYGFSRDYGVCTDNHEVSPCGYNSKTDVYQTVTIQTKDMTHGSEEWKAAIEYNKQLLISHLGNGDERTVLKVLWGAITTIQTVGKTGGMSDADVAEAEYWADRISKELYDAKFHKYWQKDTPLTMLPMDEPTFGKIRHGAGEADIQKDPLLAALCDPTHLFPGKGQSIANEPGQGWNYDAHWMLPRMGTGWYESYTPEQYGTGGVAQWPVNTADHFISKKDGEVVTLQEVTENALDLETEQAYWEIGEVDASGMLIRKDGSGSKSKTSVTSPDDEDEDLDPDDDGDDGDDSDDGDDKKPDSSSTKKNTTNHYYITMSVPFQNNASNFNVWDSNIQNWRPLPILSMSSIEVNGWTISSKIAVDGRTPYIDIVYNGSGTPNDGVVGYFSIPKGSFVSKENTTWDSPMNFAADILELAECVECHGGHSKGVVPLELHQKFVKLHHIEDLRDSYPCVKVGPTTDPTDDTPDPDLHFCVFRHQEDWQTDYNVQLNKYDYEINKYDYEMGAEQSPLEGSTFTLYEKFDDKDEVNRDNDGGVELYEGTESGEYPDKDWQSGYTSSPVIWDDFREVNSYTTDKNGHIETDVPKNYHYEKTYCDGHPAPEFVPVPAYEEDKETGENNQDEIDEAQEKNKTYAKKWIEYYEACQEKAGERSGVHFHWLGDGVLEDEIRSIAESGGNEGETPNGGPTECFEKEKSYEASGCKKDTEDTYDKFINLKYTYTWKEIKAREGYIQHDTHTDDVLIEAITTNSSQGGATSQFAIGDEKYDKYITINKSANDTDSKDTEEEKTTLFGMLRKAVVANSTDEADDDAADREPLVRENYDFVKTGFAALKETVLDAVKFITGNLATPSNATDSEADDEDQGDDDGQEDYLPDMDLIGSATDTWKEPVGGLFTIRAFAASTYRSKTSRKYEVLPQGQRNRRGRTECADWMDHAGKTRREWKHYL